MTDLGPVAIVSQSDRTDRITNPLETTDVPFTVDPDSFDGYQFVIVETPDREMLQHVIKNTWRDSTLLFRMRGDPFWGIHHWYDHPIPPVRWAKKEVALGMLRHVDGCVALAYHQARKYYRTTNVPTQLAQLSIDVDEWPTVEHTDREIRAVTLTNCMYPEKVDPLIRYAPVVNTFLERVGGYWRIGGGGIYSDRLERGLSHYDHIEYGGYLDAKKELKRANVMLHLSEFDAFPNVVLEASAAQLPIITTDHPAFTMHDVPTHPVDGDGELRSALEQYVDPSHRQTVGNHNRTHVRDRFNHDEIGKDWKQALMWFKENL